MKNSRAPRLLVSIALASLLFGASGAGADDAAKTPPLTAPPKGRATRQTLPGALGWLWQGYPMK